MEGLRKHVSLAFCSGKTTCAKLYGEVLKHLGFLSSGDVVCKTASDLGGSVVGEAQQKVLSVLQRLGKNCGGMNIATS